MTEMNNASHLPQNLAQLSVKMDELNGAKEKLKIRLGLQSKPMENNEWLERIANIEKDVKEVKIKISKQSPNSSLNFKLNGQVIQYLEEVTKLIALGEANPETVKAFLEDLKTGPFEQFSGAKLKRYISRFSKSNKIDSNDQFGDVYKGQIGIGGVHITVKVLKEDVVENTFISEVKILSKASHRNVVKLYGYCFDPNMKAVVYEYMEKGSFDKLLYGNPGKRDWIHFFNAAIETARGLAYLHEGCDTTIIHYDIKASNVLFDSRFCPKIADFGISKLLGIDKSHYTLTKTRGTPGYAAPEMSIEGSHITSKCDVYSFGMMLFEVLRMGKNKVVGQVWFPPQVWDQFKKGQLDEIIVGCGIKNKSYIEKAQILCKVALWCSQLDPEKRPSMSNVVKMLEMQIPVEDPTDPKLKLTAQVESQ